MVDTNNHRLNKITYMEIWRVLISYLYADTYRNSIVILTGDLPQPKYLQHSSFGQECGFLRCNILDLHIEK